MHIVLRSRTVLHNLQRKRTSSSVFCSCPRGFPLARAVTSSSSNSFLCCLFPYVSIICLPYFSLWFSKFRSPPLAPNWRRWGISSPASSSPHPNSCLFLFSQEPHFLLLKGQFVALRSQVMKKHEIMENYLPVGSLSVILQSNRS